MEMINKKDVELQDTELRLGLPGTQGTKRPFEESTSDVECVAKNTAAALPSKARVMGWPPIRSYRKNCTEAMKKEDGGKYVKVSMDGAPYLRKIDMKLYQGYPQLFESLKDMFQVQVGEHSDRKGYNGGDYVPTYEDKDGDWMLVGDVPWEMFINSCKRLRIMKSSEAKGLASSSYN